MIHRSHDQRKRSRETRSQKRIRRNRRGGIQLKRVDQVIQRRLEDGEEARSEHHQPDARDDPVHARVRRPACEELTAAEEY